MNILKYSVLFICSSAALLRTQAPELTYRVLTGHQVRPYLARQAEMTITILQEYPYLYHPEGGVEAEDVDCYAASTETIMVGGWHDGKLIALVVGLPLEQFEDKPCGFYPHQLLGVIPQLEGYFYLALLLVEKQYWHQGIAQRLMSMFDSAVRATKLYTHLCTLVLELNYQENPPPATYDYYYERSYQRYFKEKEWTKHEPLIAYMAGGTPHMRLWSVELE